MANGSRNPSPPPPMGEEVHVRRRGCETKPINHIRCRDGDRFAQPILGVRLEIGHRPLVRHGRAYPGHPRLTALVTEKTWMPGTSPGRTNLYAVTEPSSAERPGSKSRLSFYGCYEI